MATLTQVEGSNLSGPLAKSLFACSETSFDESKDGSDDISCLDILDKGRQGPLKR